MASQASFSVSASRKRYAKSELWFHSLEEPRSEEVAELLSTEPPQSVEKPKHLKQSTDTEVRNHAWEAAGPFCSTTRSIIQHSGSSSGGLVGVPLKQTGTLVRGLASCDLQRNATHSTEALEGSHRTQDSARSHQDTSESSPHLHGLMDNGVAEVDVGNRAALTTTEVIKAILAESPHGVAHLNAHQLDAMF
eukprot:Blabericola_migrator_1__7164@NODE_3634_length_1619_cov_4_032861_g2253_i0_p1_GENE_NODE_3634_length_1619_cov_4_032861_g2253_i0NODE_3634_length_1619_cov_4_032861_g2253_i0_p1_ORF_typecomplete_len192_score19_44_NODE_3634_length_1619_cov_4_032861_g2253_i05381113